MMIQTNNYILIVFLGVIIDSKLIFNEHYVVQKNSKYKWFVFKLTHFPVNILKRIYYYLAYPYLFNCIEAGGICN